MGSVLKLYNRGIGNSNKNYQRIISLLYSVYSAEPRLGHWLPRVPSAEAQSKLVGHFIKRILDVVSKSRSGRDDRHGNQRGQQGVFDGGGARFIGDEIRNQVLHNHCSTKAA